MPDLHGEKTVVLGRFTHLSYPGQVNFSHNFPYNAWWTIYMRKKELAWLEGWPTPNGRVTRLARPTILQVNTLAHPARSIQSGWDNKSMGKCSLRQSEKYSSAVLDNQSIRSTAGSVKGINLFLTYTLNKVDLAGRVTLFPGTTFLQINRA